MMARWLLDPEKMRGHENPSHEEHASRETADLFLSGDGTLLELRRALRHPSIFGEVLALRVPDLHSGLLVPGAGAQQPFGARVTGLSLAGSADGSPK